MPDVWPSLRLAAIALLYLEEENAFWCLVTIVEVFMPRDYYTKTLLGSQVRAREKRQQPLQEQLLPDNQGVQRAARSLN